LAALGGGAGLGVGTVLAVGSPVSPVMWTPHMVETGAESAAPKITKAKFANVATNNGVAATFTRHLRHWDARVAAES